ncbi:MAG: DUF3046 domain-containing protein [Propioniciclava sp.]
MREQELRRRMERHIGPLSDWWSRDVVLVSLGHRTVTQALDAGIPAQQVWRAVVDFLELPASER